MFCLCLCTLCSTHSCIRGVRECVLYSLTHSAVSFPAANYRNVHEILLAHRNKLMQNWFYSNAQLVYVIEAQMGSYSVEPFRNTLIDWPSNFTRHPKTIFMGYEASEKRYVHGVTVNNEDKQRFVDSFTTFLETERISWMSKDYFITSNNGGLAAMQEKANLQFHSFKKCIRMPQDPDHGKAHITFSGKSQGADDIVMVTLMTCYHAQVFYADTRWLSMTTVLTPRFFAGYNHNVRALNAAGGREYIDSFDGPYITDPKAKGGPPVGEILRRVRASDAEEEKAQMAGSTSTFRYAPFNRELSKRHHGFDEDNGDDSNEESVDVEQLVSKYSSLVNSFRKTQILRGAS